MTAHKCFRILTMAGIFATAIGGLGSYYAGRFEAEEKDRIANERINKLQTDLTLSAEKNAELVNKFTKKTVEETAKKHRKTAILDEARKKLHKKRMVSTRQRKIYPGR